MEIYPEEYTRHIKDTTKRRAFTYLLLSNSHIEPEEAFHGYIYHHEQTICNR